jgi:hypothetical protein
MPVSADEDRHDLAWLRRELDAAIRGGQGLAWALVESRAARFAQQPAAAPDASRDTAGWIHTAKHRPPAIVARLAGEEAESVAFQRQAGDRLGRCYRRAKSGAEEREQNLVCAALDLGDRLIARRAVSDDTELRSVGAETLRGRCGRWPTGVARAFREIISRQRADRS